MASRATLGMQYTEQIPNGPSHPNRADGRALTLAQPAETLP